MLDSYCRFISIFLSLCPWILNLNHAYTCEDGVMCDWHLSSCLVTIEMCVAVVRKTKQTKKNSDDEDVILQDASKQLVCSHSSPASSSSHILTRLLSLHPLFFLKEADCKPIKGWDALETASVGARRDGRLSDIFVQIQQSPNLHACLHMFGPDECASSSAWLTRRSNGKCQEMCLFRFLRQEGRAGVRLIRSAGLVFWQLFPPPHWCAAYWLWHLQVCFPSG